MLRFVRLSFGMLVRLFRGRQSLLLENLALRQQLVMLKRRHPRPSLGLLDKLFWVIARRVWSGWKQALLVVTPETVIRWHRAGFRMYWRLISGVRRQVGRKQTPKEIQELIFRMVAENPTWGAPRIHGELRMLGFDLSERTISRWMKRAPRGPDRAKRWLAFLRNHREAIAAMDFFTVPTITFGVLYCFFIISHDRRRILHINVTKHPTSGWIIQQMREAFPFEASRKYLIFDRDQKFGFEVIAVVKATRIIPKRTSFRSPWQNGIAERWVGSCRRDLLDHMAALNERHLKRLLLEYVRYHHEDRTHLGLEKRTPDGRIRSVASGRVLSQERLGGLHHRYDRAAGTRLSFDPSLIYTSHVHVPAQESFRAPQRNSWSSADSSRCGAGRNAPFSAGIEFWRDTSITTIEYPSRKLIAIARSVAGFEGLARASIAGLRHNLRHKKRLSFS
jgi:putative transposase